MFQKILKVNNSEGGFIDSILISFHTNHYHDDCSHYCVRLMLAFFNIILKPAFSLILFLRILHFVISTFKK